MIKGLGKQNSAALWTFISFYCVSLPLAYFLGFKAHTVARATAFQKIEGLPGMYLGFIAGLLVVNLAYLVIIYFLDWRVHSKKMLRDLQLTRLPVRPNPTFTSANPQHCQQEYQPLLDRPSLLNDNLSLLSEEKSKSLKSSSNQFYSLNAHTLMLSEMSARDLN